MAKKKNGKAAWAMTSKQIMAKNSHGGSKGKRRNGLARSFCRVINKMLNKNIVPSRKLRQIKTG